MFAKFLFSVLLFFVFSLKAGVASEEKFSSSISPSKVKTRSYIKNENEEPSQRGIVIPLRGFSDIKDATGTFFDHYTLQNHTKLATFISFPTRNPSDEEKKNYFKHLEEYTRQYPYGLKVGRDWEGKKLPFLAEEPHESGLLFIPGRMRDREYNFSRKAHEEKLIRGALKRGQPIFAVCAGSWRLWEELYKQDLWELDQPQDINLPEFYEDVKDHSASRMMKLSDKTGEVVYNMDIHGVVFKEDTLLGKIINLKKGCALKTNSVHWKKIKKSTSPKTVEISGTSIQLKSIERNNRHGNRMCPEKDVIEGFETKFGAPVIGIQFHPEAYSRNNRFCNRLIRFMSEAGEAYYHKRRMLEELTSITP